MSEGEDQSPPAVPDEEAQRDFLRRLRHELRTPINHILGYTELLLEEAGENGDPSHLADLRRIQHAGRETLGLVTETLDAEPASPAGVDIIALSRALRTPLTTVIGYCDLLREEAGAVAAGQPNDVNAAYLADLEKIEAAAQRLLTITQARLDLAASRSGRFPPDSAAASESRLPYAGAGDVGSHLTGRILVADDNLQNRDLLSRRLSRLGHHVISVPDGGTALDRLRAEPFDLLLLDVMMPGMNGMEVLARLRDDARLRELPVIVLSALDEVETAVACIGLGADDYLPKPCDTVLLRARINACLEKKRLRDREVEYLRQAARVTGAAVIAELLTRRDDTEFGSWESLNLATARQPQPPHEPITPDESDLLAAIDAEIEWVDLAKGDVLFQAGDPSEGVYIVIAGRLQVLMPATEGHESTGALLAGEIRRGETIGELELFTGKERPVTIIALRDSRLAYIGREGFEQLARDRPRFLTRATRDIIGRLRVTFQLQPAAGGVTSFALIPISPSVPLSDFAHELAAELSNLGPTLHLSSARLPGLFGERMSELLKQASGADEIRLIAWLNELELDYRYVVYETGDMTSNWARRCLRQADRVILVAAGDPTEAVSWHDLDLSVDGSDTELVILRPELGKADDTGAWLARWPASAHYQVCLSSSDDLQRLVRLLTGRALGLVLSGGVARGWAHVGAIRALEEAGLAIDLLGGTSIGALIAGCAASGAGWQEIQAYGQLMSSSKQLFDYTLPAASLFRGAKAMSVLRQLYGDRRIEDLWRPYFCVSSSLKRAEPVIHRRGALRLAVRASISLAGLFVPVRQDGDILVDGAYLDDLPIDIMHNTPGAGTVIAVNVTPRHEPLTEWDTGPSVSGWRVLGRRLAPWSASIGVPSISTTILRAASLNGARQLALNERLADLVINPPVGQFGSLDFSAFRRLIDLGYETARAQIELWQHQQSQ